MRSNVLLPKWSASFGVALLGLGLATSSVSAQTWGSHGVTVHEVPMGFDLSWNITRSINNYGQVAGQFLGQAAVFSIGGGITELGSLGGGSGYAYSINNLGQVAGSSNNRAFLYSAGVMTDLGFNGGAYGINDLGLVTGSGGFVSSGATSFLTGLGHGNAINDAGEVAGGLTGAAVYSGGTVTDFGASRSTQSSSTAINNSGQVVGSFCQITNVACSHPLADSDWFHAFIYSGGTFTDLGTLGGQDSYAYGIDDSGRVVGIAEAAIWEAALWENDGTGYQAYGIDDIVNDGVVNSGYDLWQVSAISQDGRYLVARGSRDGGADNVYILEANRAPTDVVPEPASIVLLASGLAAVAAIGRRRRKAD